MKRPERTPNEESLVKKLLERLHPLWFQVHHPAEAKMIVLGDGYRVLFRERASQGGWVDSGTPGDDLVVLSPFNEKVDIPLKKKELEKFKEITKDAVERVSDHIVIEALQSETMKHVSGLF